MEVLVLDFDLGKYRFIRRVEVNVVEDVWVLEVELVEAHLSPRNRHCIYRYGRVSGSSAVVVRVPTDLVSIL